jgi:hypothetical protein
MKLILTERQYKTLLESQVEVNDKPSVTFDRLYGTNLSQEYDFGDGLTSDDVWAFWVDCRDNNKCENVYSLIKKLPIIFPYYDVKKLTDRQKLEILIGMASEFNPSDIVNFAVHEIYGYNNQEHQELVKQLPADVAYNVQWVLSPDSIQQVKNKFGII